jgi:hypothetical protein
MKTGATPVLRERDFLAVDAALEDLDGRRVVGRKLGERHEFLGQMRDERGLDQRRLVQFFKHRTGGKNFRRVFNETHKQTIARNDKGFKRVIVPVSTAKKNRVANYYTPVANLTV